MPTIRTFLIPTAVRLWNSKLGSTWKPESARSFRKGRNSSRTHPGEILGLRWGDFQFGKSADDPNRYILVQRRSYRGKFSTPKGNRTRRVDMSRELREVLLAARDERLLKAWQNGRNSISDELVFPGEDQAKPISVRTVSERYFLPALEQANLRHFRFHDLRHTFGSLLIEAGAPLPYVRDQMGHSSIQITADKYVHLISGRNVRFIDRLSRSK